MCRPAPEDGSNYSGLQGGPRLATSPKGIALVIAHHLEGVANARAYPINAHAHILTIQISVGKMMYDEHKGKGVKEKRTTCHKVFINKEALYGSVLD